MSVTIMMTVRESRYTQRNKLLVSTDNVESCHQHGPSNFKDKSVDAFSCFLTRDVGRELLMSSRAHLMMSEDICIYMASNLIDKTQMLFVYGTWRTDQKGA